jgi:hypothetical protein
VSPSSEQDDRLGVDAGTDEGAGVAQDDGVQDDHAYAPSPEVCLANQYHPDLHAGHPAFGQLPLLAQAALEALEAQSRRWGHKPYFRDGVPNTRIAILNGYHKSNRLLDCMMVTNKYDPSMPKGRCSLACFCPFCAYLRGQDMLKKYGPAWRPGHWHRLVFSIRGHVCLSHFLGDDMLSLWEAMRACVRRWSPSFKGCVGWEELAVNRFWPDVLCTPHINVLIRNSSELDLELFARIIAEEWRARGLSVLPDPQITPPNSEAHFYELLEYVKPIDFLTPYNTGFLAAQATGELVSFHQEVRGFFEAYAEFVTTYRKRWDQRLRRRVLRPFTRPAYFFSGDCHGSAKSPVGVKVGVRRSVEHQERVRLRVLNAKEDEIGQQLHAAKCGEEAAE